MNLVSEQEYIFSRLTAILFESNSKVALCGIDEYFNLVWHILTVTNRQSRVEYIVDSDQSPFIGQTFQNRRISRLSDIDLRKIDTIIVLPKASNYKIAESLRQSLKNLPKKIKVAGLFSDYTAEDLKEYVEYCEKAVLKSREDFVDFNTEKFIPKKTDTKVIAYYLPQFHQMEINNRFHGQGFTEWTNTSRAIPLFAGHYQPHIPYDVGYYDLKNPDAMKRQIELAKHYGVYGFCFHYYWFSGKRVMEEPLKMLHEHKEWDVPFCINWANENWTSRWDGGNREIILEQKLDEGDDEKFMRDVLPYMKDKRYIKIDGRPVLSIYDYETFPKDKIPLLLESFRRLSKKNGFPDVFIILVTRSIFEGNLKKLNADAIAEFQPISGSQSPRVQPKGYINPYFIGSIRNAVPYLKSKIYLQPHHVDGGTVIRSALTSWDNTARNCTSGGLSVVYLGLTPQTYKTWLKDIILESKVIHKDNPDMDMVFVNSWNEWAEGSHLEPDCRYGYAYLQATREALEETR